MNNIVYKLHMKLTTILRIGSSTKHRAYLSEISIAIITSRGKSPITDPLLIPTPSRISVTIRYIKK